MFLCCKGSHGTNCSRVLSNVITYSYLIFPSLGYVEECGSRARGHSYSMFLGFWMGRGEWMNSICLRRSWGGGQESLKHVRMQC